MRAQDAHQIIMSLTAAIGPATAYMAQRLIESTSREACVSCLDLLSYARRLMPQRVEQAALRLMDHGIYEIASLRFLLENDLEALAGSTEADLDGQLLLPFNDAAQSQRT